MPKNKRIRADRHSEKIPASIRSFFYDFDGVMTDNRVYVLSDGAEAVSCHRGDGWAIGRLKKAGFFQCVISTEMNPVVSKRAEKLGIPCIQGSSNKRAALLRLAVERGINLAHAAYVGNDENDLDAMALVGFTIAPSDAHASVKSKVDLVTSAPGGYGVVREILDKLNLGVFSEREEEETRK